MCVPCAVKYALSAAVMGNLYWILSVCLRARARMYACRHMRICTGAHAHIRVYAQVLTRIVEIEVYDWAVLWVIFLVIYLGSQV